MHEQANAPNIKLITIANITITEQTGLTKRGSAMQKDPALLKSPTRLKKIKIKRV